MYYILKHIRLLCVISVIIFYFFIHVSNLFSIDYFRQEYIIDTISKHADYTISQLQKCKKSKYNNFKDRTPGERIVLIYLNTLLDNLLSNNKDILEKFGRSPDEFCVDTGSIDYSSFGNDGLGLIKIDLRWAYYTLQKDKGIYDSHIIATLSHEIAHDLLAHKLEALNEQIPIYDNSSFKDNYIDINEYNFDEKLLVDNNDEIDQILTILELKTKNFEEQIIEYERLFKNKKQLDKEYYEWTKFYTTHPDYIKLRKQQEIDADNLGLNIYINTGLKPEDFGKRYISNQYLYNSTAYYPSIPDIFRTLSENNYIFAGIQAIKEKKFNEFMKAIQYEHPLDEHPSDFWRYWNARKQLEKSHIDLNSGVSNTLYFKIDLSRSRKLKELRTFLSNPDNRTLSIVNEKDPRVYLINRLFLPNSKALHYTLEFFPYNIDDVGVIQDDGTLLLRANDIYQISLIRKNISVTKRHLSLIKKKLSKYQSNHCMNLFLFPSLDPYNKLYPAIKKAFL